MKIAATGLVLLGALLVVVAAAMAPALPREAGMALCAAATLWALMFGLVGIALAGAVGARKPQRRLGRVMEWYTPRDSSAVEQAGYDLERHELHIVFTGGREYAYYRAPRSAFERLKAVDQAGQSVGQYVNWEIKPAYRYAELPAPHLRRS